MAAIAGLAVCAAPAFAHDSVDGELRGVHGDRFDGSSSDTRWSLDTGEETLRVLPTSIPALAPGDATVEVTGEESGGKVVGAVSSTSLQAVPVQGARKLAVIVFKFASDAAQVATPAEVRQRVFTGATSTSAFFREETHGKLWLSGKTGNLDGDVYGGYTLSVPNGDCSPATYLNWAKAANAAAVVDGFSAAQYQHVMYVFPRQNACGWSGLAYMPGTQSWINGDLSVRVTGHELGHNLGLHHAGSWDCTNGGAAVTLSSTCAINEYNDRFDNMGSAGSRHSHGWHLQRLGVLEASNVQTVTESGVYSMTSALDSTPEPTTLRIPRTRDAGGAVLDWYYLEVRERGGLFDDFSLADPVLGGVSIRVNDDPSRTTVSKLLDTHPSSGGIANAPLPPGETFSDGRVGVTTVSAGAGEATVAISMLGGTADTQPPSAPSGLGHSLTAAGAPRLAWNSSSDGYGVSGYAVFRDGMQIASSASASYEDLAASAGPHVYTVFADDAAGNRSAGSAPYVLSVPAALGSTGVIGDAAPVGDSFEGGGDRDAGPAISLKRRRMGGGRLLLVASARDSDGVARMSLFVDGRRVRRASGGRLRFAWRGRPGVHRVLVRATDRDAHTASLRLRLRSPG